MCDDLHGVVKCTTFIIVRNFKYATIQKYLKPLVFEKPKSFIQNKSSSPTNIIKFLFGPSNFLLYFTTLSSKNQLSLPMSFIFFSLSPFTPFILCFEAFMLPIFLPLVTTICFPKFLFLSPSQFHVFFQPSNVYFKPPKV